MKTLKSLKENQIVSIEKMSCIRGGGSLTDSPGGQTTLNGSSTSFRYTKDTTLCNDNGGCITCYIGISADPVQQAQMDSIQR